MDQNPDYKVVKKQLDAVSPSFCLAKWLQVTIHLHNGHTHSCHHPNTHKIPLEELSTNPSALHNTSFKKQQRQMMLKGERPAECQYCWNIEDLPGEHISDRTIKSSDEWALPELEKISKMSAEENINPQYLEVSFSNACNFKCSYCYPHFSSRWMNEIKEHGPYQLHYPHHQLEHLRSIGKIPYDNEESNPYVEAFWKWWPDLYPNLKVMRVTGGEPLLSPSTFRLLDEIIAKPNADLELAVNSNLGGSPASVDRFIKKITQIAQENKLRRVRLYTSVDSWGEQAEYIRNGMDFDYFWTNLERVVRDVPEVHTTIMCTFNNLSVPGYLDLLQGFLDLKKRHRNINNQHSFILDISYLRDPVHQSVLLLPKDYVESQLNVCSEFIEKNLVDYGSGKVGFSEYEKIKFMRLKQYALSTEQPDRQKYLSDFYRFFSEHDRRRGTDFGKTFPELKSFWITCREASQEGIRAEDQNV